MKPMTLFRVAAISGILCGVFIVLQRLVFDAVLPGSLFRLGTFAPQLGLVGLTGLYLYKRAELGRFGGIAFAVNFFGLIYLGAVDFARHNILDLLDPATLASVLAGPTRTVFLIVGIVFVAGVLAFGIAMLRMTSYPKVAVILYVLGFIPFALSPFFPQFVVTIAQIFAALGVVWLSLNLLMQVMKESRGNQGVDRNAAVAQFR